MNRLLLLILLFVLLFSAAGQERSLPKIEFEKYTLPNGLQVILHVDRKLPVVNVNQWFHVGSKNEPVGRTGFAHLFEHMMFQGSKNAGKYFNIVEKAGANLFEGGVNGTTDWDRTNYFATVPSASLEALLWLESDRLATLPEGIDQQKLDNQRDVVKNERRQSMENRPYGRWIKLLFENLYPYRHPYANDVIGSHQDLTAANMDDVKEFFRTWYTPNNLSLTIAGDFEPAEAKRLVQKYFGGIPAGPALDRPERVPASLEGERLVEVRDRVPQERSYFAWHSPALFDPGDADLELAGTILSDGLSARLNKALVYERQLCSDTTAFQFGRESGSNFVIWATARAGASLPEIEKVIVDQIALLAKTGPTSAELNRAKAKWEFNYISGLERIGGFGGKADLLNMYNTYLGEPGNFERDLSRHRNASTESVRQAVDKYLNNANRVLVRFRPERSGRESQVALDRAKQPPFGADHRFVVPEVRSAKLNNGIEVFVVTRSDLPKVAVTIASRPGGIYDPPGKEGLADLTITMMKMGTKTKKALEIEDAMADLGTSITGSAGREHSTMGFEVLKANLASGLAIFADVVRNPVFPETELAREKKIRLDALSQEEVDPNGIAGRVGPMLAFGRDHAFGRPVRGFPASVRGLTRGDFIQFHETLWKPGGSALVFAGDITLDEATRLAEEHFGTWSGSAPKPVKIDNPNPLGPGKVYAVNRQDAAQTNIVQILPGIARKSDDYYAVRLADAAWGGTAGARLDMNLREEKGYSYGVFSFPRFYSKSGYWAASGGVQTNKTKESIAEFITELKNFGGEKPITQSELDYARNARVRGYAQQFESLGRITGQVAQLWADELPVSELQRETDEMAKISLDAVNAVAKKYASPGGATLLLVGDLTKIQAAVKELDLGNLVVLDVEGKPAAKN
jgi:zinc protease